MRNAISAWTMGTGKVICSLILCACSAFFVYKSIGWHWMFDESIFHYINFLMDHGKVPYRDIVDINMPGAYFIDGWGIRVFGAGDLGWRMYEYVLMAVLIGSMIVIARPYDWFAGLLSGTIFLLVHALDGPQMATERDEIITVLIVAVCIFVLRVAAAAAGPDGGFRVSAGAGGLVEAYGDSSGAGAVRDGGVCVVAAKEGDWGLYMGWGGLGMALAGLMVVWFFARTGSFPAFLEVMRRIVPYYVRLAPISYGRLLTLLINKWMAALCLLAIVPIAINPDRKNWERWALAAGVGFGAISYFAQHKGTAYHRYPFLDFCFCGFASSWWLRSRGMTGAATSVLRGCCSRWWW